MSRIRKYTSHVRDRVLSAFDRTVGAAVALASATLILAWGAAPAMATVTLPSTGVDTAGYVTALVTALGSVVALCVGAVFAFMAIKKGIRWVRGI